MTLRKTYSKIFITAKVTLRIQKRSEDCTVRCKIRAFTWARKSSKNFDTSHLGRRFASKSYEHRMIFPIFTK